MQEHADLNRINKLRSKIDTQEKLAIINGKILPLIFIIIAIAMGLAFIIVFFTSKLDIPFTFMILFSIFWLLLGIPIAKSIAETQPAIAQEMRNELNQQKKAGNDLL